jgi:hypothetical protein
MMLVVLTLEWLLMFRDHHNANRGDCLDYTSSPEGNLLPGYVNYEVLAQLYGRVPPGGGDDRRGLLLALNLPAQELVANYSMAAQRFEGSQHCDNGVCIEDLGDGYQLEVHKLLVV